MASAWQALFAPALIVAAASQPAAAQVRVIVQGQVHEVPSGVIRTIIDGPDGRRTIRDERFRGTASPGAATVTTTQTIDEDERGRAIRTTTVTRIEPIAVVAYTAAPGPTSPSTFDPPPLPPPPRFRAAPHLDVDPVAFGTAEPAPAPAALRIRRDPGTGHFITTIGVNGVPIRAIVDTGAANTILSPQDARATGASAAVVSSQRMVGIGGYTMLNLARVESLEVAGEQLGGFTAAIGQEGLGYTLLGQSEIARLGRIVIENGTMTIMPRSVQTASR
jgi:clan AA aspartic protease (TIGR02281 family)